MTRKDDKGDQPSGGGTIWTHIGATRYGRGQHKRGLLGDGMLRPSPNHWTLRLPNDDDDEIMLLVLGDSAGRLGLERTIHIWIVSFTGDVMIGTLLLSFNYCRR